MTRSIRGLALAVCLFTIPHESQAQSRFTTSPEPRVSPTISFYRLTHPIPRPAAKEFDRAEKARSKRNDEEFESRLKSAIEIAPRFTEALNNLGIHYSSRGDLAAAASLLDRAIDSDPMCAVARFNRAVLYTAERRWDDAERELRKTIDIDPGMPAARYVLGAILQFRAGFTDEAVQYLRSSASEFPQAHMRAALILRESNRNAEARAEVRAYIRSGDKQLSGLAQQWLKH